MFNSESNRHRRKRTSGKKECGKQKESATTNVNMAMPAGTALKQLPLALMLLLIVLVAKAATINTEICTFNNVTINSGAEWKDPTDPCKSYTCMGGILTEARIKCYAECDVTELKNPGQGECCPRCEGCELNGKTVPEGGELNGSRTDVCVAGKCTENHLTLQKKACPVLPCLLSEQALDPEECCPYCKDKEETSTLSREFDPLNNEECYWNYEFDANRTLYMSDNCTTCTCHGYTTLCKRTPCPILECLPQQQNRCRTSLVGTECSAKGVTYENNEVWNPEESFVCRCTNGAIFCGGFCPDIKCTSREEKVRTPDEFCPKCTLKAGKCTVFGDSHFITFDGSFHNYNFQGSCKYLLVRDGRKRLFSIRLVNGNHDFGTSSSAKYIGLKMQNTSVRLHEDMTVNVNGDEVLFPYREGPITKIERLTDTVMLTTDFGLKVEWDGDNYLQITVPPSFKDSLRGLCGNYNGLSHDDLIDGNGVIQKNVSDFGSSWRLDKKELCFERMKQPQCTEKGRDKTLCPRLFDNEVFNTCSDRLETDKYIDFCKHDCECNYNMCHLNTLTAYARECERLDAISPDWRNSVRWLYNTTNYEGLEL